ncbi:MAG: WYL domain-containing protein, partial [Ignavibacteriaceae bacterium]|nr:WYL domain-containing protein [Ignavibacteriaceae bacterium]
MKDFLSDNLRRTELLARLMNGEKLSILDLALEYEVSEVTINRDLKYLRFAGLQIYSRKKILILDHAPETELLTGYLAEYLAFKLNRRLLFTQLQAVHAAGMSDLFQILTLCAKAVDENRRIHFRYERITDDIENEYIVKPLELKLNEYNWSLIAVKEGENIEKLFYLSRIKEIELLKPTQAPEEDLVRQPIFPIVLRFSPMSRNSIYSKIWFQNFQLIEEADGYITLKTESEITKRLASWCLRWEDN